MQNNNRDYFNMLVKTVGNDTVGGITVKEI